MDQKCVIHKNENIFEICTHPVCNRSKALCKFCSEQHKNFHMRAKLPSQPDLKDYIIPLKELRQRVKKMLYQVHEDLQKLQDRALLEIQERVDPENKIDELINEIKGIKEEINREFDYYIENLKTSFEKPIKEQIDRIWKEITAKCESMGELQKSVETNIHALMMIYMNDLPYQTTIQQYRLEELIYQRRSGQFKGYIDDDVALRFIGTFQKELENLIVKDNQDANYISQSKREEELRKYKQTPFKIELQDTYEDLKMEFQRKNWMFFFESGSKNFHYLDISEKKPVFNTVSLNIDFLIYPNSKSVLGADGQIYLLGGYDEKKIREDNEDQFQVVYQLDLNNQILKKVFNMITLRHSFSVCCVKDSIFVVGGMNYKEGSLVKCEKINLTDRTVAPISNCREAAINSGLVKANDDYLFQIGGMKSDIIDNKQTIREMTTNFIELYMIDFDDWKEPISYDFYSEQYQIERCFFPGATQINQNNIFIFGGCNEEGEPINHSFLLQFYQEESADQSCPEFAYEIKEAPEISESAFYKEGFILVNNQIYARPCLEDNLQVQCLIGNQWKPL